MEETNKITPQPEKNFMEVKMETIEVLKGCYDPEIPVNIWELGLIYEVNVSPELNVQVLMTLTSPFCPVAQSLPEEVKQKILEIEGVKEAAVEVTFEPRWTQDKMSESAKLELGFM